MTVDMRACCVLALGGLLAAWQPRVDGATAAGRFVFAQGQVTVTADDGAVRRAVRGAEVFTGDTIRTAVGRAQVRFTDKGFVSLTPNTTFAIDEYRFSGEPAAGDRSFFKLLRGGLRFVTGLVGRKLRQNYQIASPIATIGIRGTNCGTSLDLDGGAEIESQTTQCFLDLLDLDGDGEPDPDLGAEVQTGIDSAVAAPGGPPVIVFKDGSIEFGSSQSPEIGIDDTGLDGFDLGNTVLAVGGGGGPAPPGTLVIFGLNFASSGRPSSFSDFFTVDGSSATLGSSGEVVDFDHPGTTPCTPRCLFTSGGAPLANLVTVSGSGVTAADFGPGFTFEDGLGPVQSLDYFHAVTIQNPATQQQIAGFGQSLINFGSSSSPALGKATHAPSGLSTAPIVFFDLDPGSLQVPFFEAILDFGQSTGQAFLLGSGNVDANGVANLGVSGSCFGAQICRGGVSLTGNTFIGFSQGGTVAAGVGNASDPSTLGNDAVTFDFVVGQGSGGPLF